MILTTEPGTAAQARSSSIRRTPATTDQPGARVAFYSHDTFGLGHLRRCQKIATALSRRLPPLEGMVLTGSAWSHLFPMPAGFACVQLPPVVKTGRRVYRARDDRRTFEEVLAARGAQLSEALYRFRPDLLIVDNVPCGLAGELLPVLNGLRRRGTRVALSLRDVLDDDFSVRSEWRSVGADAAAAELYDEVWIFGDSGAPAYRALPARARAKSVFCGYLAERIETMGEPHTARQFDAARPRVLVTGGGGGDAGALVATYLLALRRYRPGGTHHLVLGPDFPADLEPQSGDLARLGATSIRFEPDLPGAMARADVVVSMAGYNTVCETLAAGRRMVLVPRLWPRREQWLRARALERAGRAEMLTLDDLTPRALWSAVRRALACGEHRAVRFAGAARVAERAAELLGLDRMPGRPPRLARA